MTCHKHPKKKQDGLRKSKILNARTEKALRASDRGIGLITCKDLDDLFKKLGI